MSDEQEQQQQMDYGEEGNGDADQQAENLYSNNHDLIGVEGIIRSQKNEIEKKNFREMSVQDALPHIVKILLKSQEEMKEKKQEIELSIISDETNFTHKIIDRAIVDQLASQAAKEIEDERNLRRMQNTESEKLKFRVKCLEDDLQKQQMKADKRA